MLLGCVREIRLATYDKQVLLTWAVLWKSKGIIKNQSKESSTSHTLKTVIWSKKEKISWHIWPLSSSLSTSSWKLRVLIVFFWGFLDSLVLMEKGIRLKTVKKNKVRKKLNTEKFKEGHCITYASRVNEKIQNKWGKFILIKCWKMESAEGFSEGKWWRMH